MNGYDVVEHFFPIRHLDEHREVAHAWAVCLYHRSHYLDFAEVLDEADWEGVMGRVSYAGSCCPSSHKSRILAASWAIQHAYGYGGKGCSSDAEELRKLGWRTDYADTGSWQWDAYEPDSIAFLREEIQKDMAPYSRFIHHLADQLYGHGYATRDWIRELWRQHHA